jgi:two-component system, NtrC family, nitrogen regulation sensor histidine kinase NtrY
MKLSESNSLKKIFGYFFSGLFLIFVAMILRLYFSIQDRPENITKNFNQVLHEKEKLLLSTINKINGYSFLTEGRNRIDYEHGLHDLFKKNGIILFVYNNDSLVYWSSNSVSNAEKVARIGNLDTTYFEKQRNGWYEIIKQKKPSKGFIGQILIKHQYPFENEYLRNNFQKDFNVPEKSEINLIKSNNSIFSHNGKYLFSLKISSDPQPSAPQVFILFILYLTSFILLIVSLYKLYCSSEFLFNHKPFFIFSFTLDVIIIRLIQFYYHLPEVLYKTKLFGPGSFSFSHFLPSLGDFLVNSILLLFVSYIIYRHYPGFVKTLTRKKSIKISVAILLLLIVVVSFFAIIELVRTLLVNSTISFNLQDISSLDSLSVIGCFIISALFLSFFLIAIRLLNSFIELSGLNTFHYLNQFKIKSFSLSGIVVYLILFSITGTFIMNYFNNSIEKEKRNILALKLGTTRDPMAELMFSKTEQKIVNDSVLLKIISDSSILTFENAEDSIEHYLHHQYFNGYWNNYTLQATLCSESKSLRIQPNNNLVNCRKYFQNIISEFGKPTISRNLYFLDYGYGYKNYLAIIPSLIDTTNSNKIQNAYIEISSKLIFKDLGYPEMLIDKNEGQTLDLSDYSYGYYRNGRLSHRVGNIQYALEIDSSMAKSSMIPFYYSRDGNSHYYYPIDKNNILIISKKESTIVDRIAPFSYLFFFFAIFMILFFMIIRFSDIITISFLRLGDRLQISMIGMLAISLLITGGLTVYYIFSLNTTKNSENMSERTHSLLVELQHKIGNPVDFIEPGRMELNELMTEFSNVFFVDVNLYSPNARLIATSRPEIFEEGLSSGLMNREAFANLTFAHSSYYFHKEQIGENGYNSAYIPFFNERNQLLGYLNLPYFAHQNDLKKEISVFLVAFINVYVFLIIIGIFIALLISNYISRPLRIIASRISSLSYGRQNEKIEWKRRDEIGKLVDEYNRMIDELIRSADLLARSERESAWREMAKQVAHEIKNPLTPMKLSIQHLEKAWKDETPDWEERLKRFTATMTEQIDSLSTIATEFSDFAKMPVTKPELININEILENVKALYHDTSQIRFDFIYDRNRQHIIRCDSKQLLRVFTNLINNAIQAIGDMEGGRVTIELESAEKKYILKITDSGIGISAELADRIFQPNFTTKSGGMGLGLAIVRSIIEGLGGEITLASTPSAGATFIIVFPAQEP